jgi:hypothetical protein
MRNFIFLLLIVSSPTMAYDFLPNPQTTPGLTSGHSIQEICSKGYPERMRNVSQKTKDQIYKIYKVDVMKCRGGCKIDHLIPL